MNLKRKRSLRVDSISKHFTVTIAKKKKACSFPIWRVTFSTVSFTYKGELAQLGEGQEEEINSVYPGNCSCYKWPPRAQDKRLCETVSQAVFLEHPLCGTSLASSVIRATLLE